MAQLGKKNKAQDDGEAWISSFADMMCLLLGFFMILYSLSFIDDRQFYTMGKTIAAQFSNGSDNNKKKAGGEVTAIESQARAFKILASVMNLGDPIVASEKIRTSFAQSQTFEEAADEISQSIRASEANIAENKKKLVQKVELGTLTITLPYHPSLDQDGTPLDRETRAILTELAKYLQQEDGSYSLNIIGHTSHLETPSNPSPLAGSTLGFRRSKKIAEAIILMNITALNVTVSSRGSSDPIVPYIGSKDLKSKKFLQNRRVELVIRRS